MKKIVIGVVLFIAIIGISVFCFVGILNKNINVNEENISIEESSNDEIRFGRVEEKLVDGLEIDRGYETIDDGYTQEELKKMFPEHYYYFSQINDNYFTEWEMLEMSRFDVGEQFSANLYKDDVYSVVINEVEEGKYELKINNDYIVGDIFLGGFLGVLIVDFNENDEFKEIIILDDKTSTYTSSSIYRYNGKEIINMGSLPVNGKWYLDAETGNVVEGSCIIPFLSQNTVVGYYRINNNKLEYIEFNKDIEGKEFIINEEQFVDFYESEKWDYPDSIWEGKYETKLKIGDRVKLLDCLSQGDIYKVQINNKVGYISYWNGI